MSDNEVSDNRGSTVFRRIFVMCEYAELTCVGNMYAVSDKDTNFVNIQRIFGVPRSKQQQFVGRSSANARQTRPLSSKLKVDTSYVQNSSSCTTHTLRSLRVYEEINTCNLPIGGEARILLKPSTTTTLIFKSKVIYYFD